jgi:hypothetical protein
MVHPYLQKKNEQPIIHHLPLNSSTCLDQLVCFSSDKIGIGMSEFKLFDRARRSCSISLWQIATLHQFTYTMMKLPFYALSILSPDLQELTVLEALSGIAGTISLVSWMAIMVRGWNICCNQAPLTWCIAVSPTLWKLQKRPCRRSFYAIFGCLVSWRCGELDRCVNGWRMVALPARQQFLPVMWICRVYIGTFSRVPRSTV